MNYNDLITVVIPVYNVKNYLEKCVDSVISQTYKNVEIILLNDGSSDGSAEICNKFAVKDERVRVIHKKNTGVSDTRNLGISVAKGKYIFLIDGDDYIEKELLEKLYYACVEKKAQIACCGKVQEWKNYKKIFNMKNEFCVEKEEAMKKFLLFDDIDASCSDKLFDIDLFKDVMFPTNRRYEDMSIIYRLIDNADKIVHINYIGYHYVMREGSFINVDLDKSHLDIIVCIKELREFIYKNYNSLSLVVDSYYYLQMSMILRKLHNALNSGRYIEAYCKLKKEYNEAIIKVLFNKYIPFYKKVMVICIYFNLYGVVNILKK